MTATLDFIPVRLAVRWIAPSTYLNGQGNRPRRDHPVFDRTDLARAGRRHPSGLRTANKDLEVGLGRGSGEYRQMKILT